MNRKLITNFIYQALYQVLLLFLPIVTVPIVSRALLPSGIGIFNYVNSVVSYFVIVASFGLANYAVREISFVQNDKKMLSKKFWELQSFNLFFSFIVFLGYVVFCFFTEYKLLFFAQSLTVFSVIFDVSWFFQGIEDFKKITITNSFIKIISFLLIIVFVKRPEDIYIYTLISSASVLLSSFSFWFFLKGKIFFTRVKFKETMSHFFPALNFFILKVSATVFTSFNTTLLGILSTMTAVGIFSNSLTLVTISSSLINTMNIVLLPRMSALVSKNEEDRLMKTLEQTIHFQLFFTIALLFGIAAITDKMILWFFGPGFEQINTIVPILAPVVVFQSLHQGIANQYLVPKNEMFSYNLTMIFGTIVSILVGILLIPKIGVYGAALGFLIGQFTLAISRAIVLVKKTSFKFNFEMIVSYIFSGIIMAASIWITTKAFPSTILTTIIQAIIGVIIYFILTTLFKTNPFIDIFKKIYK